MSEFLDHIVAATNMRCATPRSALEGECGFLAANLYAKSVFGEDALVNVSVEKQPDGKLAGYIRIRYTVYRFKAFTLMCSFVLFGIAVSAMQTACRHLTCTAWCCMQWRGTSYIDKAVTFAMASHQAV